MRNKSSSLDLSGQDWSGTDFRGQDLRGVNWKDSVLRGCNFEGSKLDGSNLQGADLIGANFKGASMEGVRMKFGNWTDCSFEGAILDGSVLGGVTCSNVNFEKASLDRVELGGSRLEDCNFHLCSMREIKVQYLNLKNSKMSYVDFFGLNLTESYFHAVDLTGSFLEETRGKDSKFHDCTFKNATLEASFNKLSVMMSSFNGADIKKLRVWGGGTFGNTMVGCDFRNTEMGEVVIENTTFQDCDFRGVDLTSSTLQERGTPSFRGTDFTGAKRSPSTFLFKGRGFLSRPVPLEDNELVDQEVLTQEQIDSMRKV